MSDERVGSGEKDRMPRELKGFAWGAFLWGGIWAAAYRVWIGLFAFVPVLGLIMNVMLGLRGAEWAYRKGSIPDVARYKSAQRTWVIAWAVMTVFAIPAGIGVASALAIYGVTKYVTTSKRDEARAALAEMGKGMAACAARGDLPESSEWVPAELSDVAGKKYHSKSADWTNQAAFACSGFKLRAPQYFRYRWERDSSPRSGQFRAEADLNADGRVDESGYIVVNCTTGKCEITQVFMHEPSMRF